LRAGALLAAIALFVATPMMAVASAASEPVSLGDWMNAIFGAHRPIDPAQKGIGGTPPPAPIPQVQTSSEPAPPQPLASAPVPRLWIRRDSSRRRHRR
jgi:hypothetical protein